MTNTDELDIESLISALDDEDNESLLNLDHRKLKAIKNDMLQKLALPRDKLKKLHTQLSTYRYVDEINEQLEKIGYNIGYVMTTTMFIMKYSLTH